MNVEQAFPESKYSHTESVGSNFISINEPCLINWENDSQIFSLTKPTLSKTNTTLH